MNSAEGAAFNSHGRKAVVVELTGRAPKVRHGNRQKHGERVRALAGLNVLSNALLSTIVTSALGG